MTSLRLREKLTERNSILSGWTKLDQKSLCLKTALDESLDADERFLALLDIGKNGSLDDFDSVMALKRVISENKDNVLAQTAQDILEVWTLETED